MQEEKIRYYFVDGLRGVAALLVIWYHVFEAFATSPIDQVGKTDRIQTHFQVRIRFF